jgi:hypothetical protein
VELVDFNGAGASDFGQLAARGTPQKIHLPQTIRGGRIALREEEICLVCGFDKRNATVIAPDHSVARIRFFLEYYSLWNHG